MEINYLGHDQLFVLSYIGSLLEFSMKEKKTVNDYSQILNCVNNNITSMTETFDN